MDTNDPLFRKMAEKIRRYTKDRPEMNKLLGKVESDPEDIELALELSVEMFNLVEPVTVNRYNLANHPSPYLIIHGAVIELLTMAGLCYTRNELKYSDQGISVSVNDKGPEYSKWAQGLIQDYYMKAKKLKGLLNLNACRGGIPSEFATCDWFYGG